ncbi:hypothetical protein G7Y89_g4479 [Cudoniella acicularis]|uniref:Uncharacterized protein n=1 Tax=Cudoniella acicularis TaxID=354080 RepID=A0A8H4RPD1_9HELO|nr:hypothetical protein G7Y89_g4479 [Cudoniella acicularis]
MSGNTSADEKAISIGTPQTPPLNPITTNKSTLTRSHSNLNFTHNTTDIDLITHLGYTSSPHLHRNRSLFTLLFQTLAIAAIPYGEGGPLISAIYGGGQLSIFVAEGEGYKVVLSFVTGWVWLVGNWTITLSVNFGFASLISATIAIYHPAFAANDWQLLLIFYAICLLTFLICSFGNRFLPMIDTICAAWTAISILIILIALSVKADVGRHSAAYTLGNYDTSLSGWGGFTFFYWTIACCLYVLGDWDDFFDGGGGG